MERTDRIRKKKGDGERETEAEHIVGVVLDGSL